MNETTLNFIQSARKSAYERLYDNPVEGGKRATQTVQVVEY